MTQSITPANTADRLGSLAPELLKGILDELSILNLCTLSRTSRGFRRYVSPLIDHQVSQLDADTVGPIIDLLIATPGSTASDAPIADVQKICLNPTLRRKMLGYQEARARSVDTKHVGSHKFYGFLRTLVERSDFAALFAAAAGNTRALQLLADTHWAPYHGVLYYAARWELGYCNPFVPPPEAPKEEVDYDSYWNRRAPRGEPRSPGVVDVVLQMKLPERFRRALLHEQAPCFLPRQAYGRGTYRPWPLSGSNLILRICSAEPSDSAAAARIIGKMLALLEDAPRDDWCECLHQCFSYCEVPRWGEGREPKILLAWWKCLAPRGGTEEGFEGDGWYPLTRRLCWRGLGNHF